MPCSTAGSGSPAARHPSANPSTRSRDVEASGCPAITAGARTHLDEHIATIVRIGGKEKGREALDDGALDLLGGRAISRCERAHLAVGLGVGID